MSGQRDMDKLKASLALLAALCALPVGLHAATPSPLKGQTPVVVLLPQIEELEETSAARDEGKAPAIEKPAVRDAFPPARQFWKRWRTGSESRSTSARAEQSVEVPPPPRREVVTVSDLRLEPIMEVPAQRQPESIPHQVMQPQGYGASSSASGIPSAELIYPMPGAVDAVYDPSCDQQTVEPSPHAVSPRSLKMGSRIRFPHLSNLFH